MTTATASPFSSRLQALLDELNDLETAILPVHSSALPEHVRSYLLLATAAFEAAIEDLVILCAQVGVASWKGNSRRSRVPCALLVAEKNPDFFGHWPPLASALSPFEPDPSVAPVEAAVTKALKALENRIRQNNHGVRKSNVLQMLAQLGIPESEIDATWLRDIDAFGSDRNEAAHRSTRDVRLKTARDEVRRVRTILGGLQQLETTLIAASR